MVSLNFRYLFGLPILLSGCSHHPLPVDVVRKDTPRIIESIRCETREAIKIAVANEFARIGNDKRHSFTIELANKILSGDSSFKEVERAVDDKSIHPSAIDAYNRYKDYAVAYEFEFKITENNNESANLTFKVPVPNGTFSLGVGGGKERARQNLRTVDFDESFNELFKNVRRTDCMEILEPDKNWEYPISGKIGMKELVHTFITLNEQLRTGPGAQGVGTFSDELTFTTKYSGSVEPKVVLAPVTNNFHLAEGSGKFSSDRTDVHKLLLAFTPPPPDKKDPDPTEVVILNFPNGQSVRKNVTGGRARVRTGRRRASQSNAAERAKRKARNDVQRLRQRRIIDRIPDE